MELKANIVGAKELDELLRQLPPRVARQAAGNALRAGARIIRDEVRKDPKIRRQAIYAVPGGAFPGRKSTTERPKLMDSVRVITGQGRNAENRIVHVGFFGKASPLAHIIEFGTIPVRTAKKAGGYLYFYINGKLLRKKQVRGVTGRAPLRRAAEARANDVVKKIGEVLAKSIERIGERARRRTGL